MDNTRVYLPEDFLGLSPETQEVVLSGVREDARQKMNQEGTRNAAILLLEEDGVTLWEVVTA